MNRRLIVRVVIYTLNDVDLASGWPIRAICPKGLYRCQKNPTKYRSSSLHTRPRPTSSRHMHSIHHNQAAIKSGLSRDPHTLAIGLYLWRCFNAHHGVAIRVYLDKACALSGALIYILNIPICRVCCGVEAPAIEECLSTITICCLPR